MFVLTGIFNTIGAVATVQLFHCTVSITYSSRYLESPFASSHAQNPQDRPSFDTIMRQLAGECDTFADNYPRRCSQVGSPPLPVDDSVPEQDTEVRSSLAPSGEEIQDTYTDTRPLVKELETMAQVEQEIDDLYGGEIEDLYGCGPETKAGSPAKFSKPIGKGPASPEV